MSRIQKKPAPTMIEPEAFDEEEHMVEEEQYSPQHPALAFHAELKAAQENKEDHLENYVEVDPYADKN